MKTSLMKKIPLSILIAAILSAICAAQSAQSTSANPLEQFAAGSAIPAELSKSLDAKKAKTGDKIEARTSMDLLLHGQVIVPRDTKLIGHVTDAKPRTKDSPDSRLGIAFDRMAMKDGHEFPISVAVQAIGRPIPAQMPDQSIPGTAPGPSSAQSGQMGSAAAPISVQNSPSQYPTMATPQMASPVMPGVSALTPECHGAMGMKGIDLSSAKESNVISSNTQNIHLETGTQLMLRTE